MRKVSYILVCLLFLGIFVSCKRKTTVANPKPAIVSGLQFQQKSGADCDLADTLVRMDCARIDFRWPTISEGSEILKKSVDNWAAEHLSAILLFSSEGGPSKAHSIETAAKAFFDEHRKAGKSAMAGGWTAESSYKVLLNDGQYLTLELTTYTFQGGAHGNMTAAVATFDAQTGKRLTWDDLVTDEPAVKTIAEELFRETRVDIFRPTDGSTPFSFDENTPFSLAQNYGLVPEGIYCHYVPYEVGPYAIGNTQMVISFEALGNLAKIASAQPVTRSQSLPDYSQPATSVPDTVAVERPTAKTTSSAPPPSNEEAKPATKPAPPQTGATKPAGPATPTVTYKQNGDILLNGKKVAFETLRKTLQTHLLTYPAIPDAVNFKTVGQTGMGMRAEIKDVLDESIAGAKWVRKKTALAALNIAVGKKLEMPTQLELGQYQTSGAFAYISAQPKQADGSEMDYSGTAYAKDQSAAWFSDNAIGLLRYEKGAWKVLAYTIGVDEPPVGLWTKQFHVPKAVLVQGD